MRCLAYWDWEALGDQADHFIGICLVYGNDLETTNNSVTPCVVMQVIIDLILCPTFG